MRPDLPDNRLKKKRFSLISDIKSCQSIFKQSGDIQISDFFSNLHVLSVIYSHCHFLIFPQLSLRRKYIYLYISHRDGLDFYKRKKVSYHLSRFFLSLPQSISVIERLTEQSLAKTFHFVELAWEIFFSFYKTSMILIIPINIFS